MHGCFISRQVLGLNASSMTVRGDCSVLQLSYGHIGRSLEDGSCIYYMRGTQQGQGKERI
jgi:hypothetical protein